jgi:hypothetical protein
LIKISHTGQLMQMMKSLKEENNTGLSSDNKSQVQLYREWTSTTDQLGTYTASQMNEDWKS